MAQSHQIEPHAITNVWQFLTYRSNDCVWFNYIPFEDSGRVTGGTRVQVWDQAGMGVRF